MTINSLKPPFLLLALTIVIVALFAAYQLPVMSLYLADLRLC